MAGGKIWHFKLTETKKKKKRGSGVHHNTDPTDPSTPREPTALPNCSECVWFDDLSP